MKIAVMMAAYNSARYIADALTSLLRQRDAAQLDIIVVNDGSTDATGEIVRDFAAPEVRLIEQENRGIARTRNVLLSAIAPDTDFVTLLDSDDLSPPGRFSRDLENFRDDPALELVFGESLLFRRTGADPLLPDFEAPTLRIRGVQMGAGLYRYDLVSRTGRYDQNFSHAEDLDFMMRMFEQSPKYLVIKDLSYYYRRHQSNTTNDGRALHRGIARAMFLSAKRKAGGRAPPLPRGLFDMTNYVNNPDWWA